MPFHRIVIRKSCLLTTIVLILIQSQRFSNSQDDFGGGDYTDETENGDGVPSMSTTRRPSLIPQLPNIPDLSGILPNISRFLPGGSNVSNGNDRPWVNDNKAEEDTAWTRLLTFLANLVDDFQRIQGNTGNGEYVDFVRYQLNRFIDVFRYQGYDLHDHFYHCTQRVGGCRKIPKRRRLPFMNTTMTNNATTTTIAPTSSTATNEAEADDSRRLRAKTSTTKKPQTSVNNNSPTIIRRTLRSLRIF